MISIECLRTKGKKQFRHCYWLTKGQNDMLMKLVETGRYGDNPSSASAGIIKEFLRKIYYGLSNSTCS